jgi:hypothetical protein
MPKQLQPIVLVLIANARQLENCAVAFENRGWKISTVTFEHQDRTNSLYDTLEDLQEDIKEIGRKIDRQNPPD